MFPFHTRRVGHSGYSRRQQANWPRALERLEDRVCLSVVPNWAVSAGGPDRDYPADIVADSDGNTYATLSIQNPDSTFDLVMTKYGPAGQLLKSQTLIEATASPTSLRLALDPAGNLYAAGRFQETIDLNLDDPGGVLTSRGGFDVFIAKYDTSGHLAWTEHFGGLASDYVGDMVVSTTDGQVSLFVAGTFGDTATFDNSPIELTSTVGEEKGAFLLKVNDGEQSGEVQWARQLQNAGSATPTNLLVSDGGEIFITGQAWQESRGNQKPMIGGQTFKTAGYPHFIFVMKCHDEGDTVAVRWAHQIAGNTVSTASGLVQTDDGALYVAGSFHGRDSDFGSVNLTPVSMYENYNYNDGYLVRIDELPTGGGAVTTWVKQLGGYGNLSVRDLGLSYDQPTSEPRLHILGDFNLSADFDPSDSSVVERVVYGEKYSADLFLLQLNTAGDYVHVWHAGGDKSESAGDLAMAPSGDIYIFGRSASPLMQTMGGTLELPGSEDTVRLGDTVLIHVNPMAPALEVLPGTSLVEESIVTFHVSAPDRRSDGEIDDLSGLVNWQLDGVPVEQAGSPITVPQLNIDRHKLTVTVTDSDNITAEFCYVFDVTPNAPTDLSVVAVSAGSSQVELVFTWSDNADQEDGFYIESTVYEGLLEPAYGWTLEAVIDEGNTTTASLFMPSSTEEIRYRVRSFAKAPDGRIIVSPVNEDVTIQPKATGKGGKSKTMSVATSSVASALEADLSVQSLSAAKSPSPTEENEPQNGEPTGQRIESTVVASWEVEASLFQQVSEESVVATDQVFASFEDTFVTGEHALSLD